MLEISCLLNDTAIPHLGPRPTWPLARRENKEHGHEIGVIAGKKEGKQSVWYSLEGEAVMDKECVVG